MGNESDTIHPPWYMQQYIINAFTIYYIVLCIIGSFGNLITIVAILFHKELRTLPNFYVLSLAMADLLVCIMIVPLTIIALSHTIPHWICEIIGYFSIALLLVSVMSLATIAFNRYILICRSYELYGKLFRMKTVILSITFQWILAFFMCSWPFLGFGSYAFNPYLGACSVSDHPLSIKYLLVFDITLLYPAAILTLGFYLAVLRKFIKSKSKIEQNISTSGGSVDGTSYTGETSASNSVQATNTGPTVEKVGQVQSIPKETHI